MRSKGEPDYHDLSNNGGLPERFEDEVASTGGNGSKYKLKQIEGVGTLQRVIIKKQASSVYGWPGNANCCNILDSWASSRICKHGCH